MPDAPIQRREPFADLQPLALAIEPGHPMVASGRSDADSSTATAPPKIACRCQRVGQQTFDTPITTARLARAWSPRKRWNWTTHRAAAPRAAQDYRRASRDTARIQDTSTGRGPGRRDVAEPESVAELHRPSPLPGRPMQPRPLPRCSGTTAAALRGARSDLRGTLRR